MGGIALASGCKEEVFSQVTRLSFPSTARLTQGIHLFPLLGN